MARRVTLDSSLLRLRHLGRIARRQPAARWFARHLRGRQYRVGPPGTVGDRIITTMIQYDVATAEERFASVGALAERFFAEVALRPIGLFVEAGAKDAGASVRAQTELGIDHVVAFEANPYTHRLFAKRAGRAGVDYRHVALIDVAGPQTFHVRLNEAGAAMADGQASLLVRPDHQPGYELVEVEGVRLDGAVADLPGRVAMWVDVEGATSMVLRGAPATLARTDVAIVEVEDRPAWDGQEWLHLDVVRHLVGSGLRPVGRDQQSRYQFNVLFVRPDS